MKTVAVIPAYNEERVIADVVAGARAYTDVVVVIDDGSSDKTAHVASAAGATVVRHPLNCGPGAATMTGVHAARILGADALVTLDADGQHNPEDIPRLLKPIQGGKADVVIGTRFWDASRIDELPPGAKRNTIPGIRRVFNHIGNVFTFLTTSRYVSDSQSGFKAFGAKAIASLDLHLSGFEFCSEIIREIDKKNWRVIEIPIRVTYSEYTMAKGQSFSRGVVTASKMLLRSFLR